ncbi:MAG TPA: hypothetical protein VD962_00025, partial [Rubricoccaceae bacterium]|nr:hypothetical protein [Rubricoccaceae bacterium]
MTRLDTSLRSRSAYRLLLFAALLAFALPASAQIVATVSNNILHVSGTSGFDFIEVTCAGGNVKVNGLDPSTGPFPCGALHSINVNAGDGGDTIDLSGVRPEDGFALGSSTILNGQGGSDAITGSAFADAVSGGTGDDLVNASGGDDSTAWVPGDGNDDVFLGEGEEDRGNMAGSPAAGNYIVHPVPDSPIALEVDAGPGDLVQFRHQGLGGTVALSTGAGNDRVDVELIEDLLSLFLGEIELDGEDGQDEVFVTPPLAPGEVEVGEGGIDFDFVMRLVSGGGGEPDPAARGGGGPA